MVTQNVEIDIPEEILVRFRKTLRPGETVEARLVAYVERSAGDMATAPEAAKILSKSIGTLYNMASKGRIPYYKPGKNLMFARSDLDAYLLRHRHSADYELADKAAGIVA